MGGLGAQTVPRVEMRGLRLFPRASPADKLSQRTQGPSTGPSGGWAPGPMAPGSNPSEHLVNSREWGNLGVAVRSKFLTLRWPFSQKQIPRSFCRWGGRGLLLTRHGKLHFPKTAVTPTLPFLHWDHATTLQEEDLGSPVKGDAASLWCSLS